MPLSSSLRKDAPKSQRPLTPPGPSIKPRSIPEQGVHYLGMNIKSDFIEKVKLSYPRQLQSLERGSELLNNTYVFLTGPPAGYGSR